ncbi:hypothetical protein [Deinococcus aquaedulcis]|uniref:hypothetical protein n=1 Tax=Deinococcus aquaedulcis TaxID=2840455 RepID=UPI001C83540C|nr:hypothetical protein [Deinococcus aquaedulcis]
MVKALLWTVALVAVGGAGAQTTPFDALFPGAQVVARTGDRAARQGMGSFAYALPGRGRFTVGYLLTLTAQSPARVMAVDLDATGGQPEVAALQPAQIGALQQVVGRTAGRCFGATSAQQAAVQAWVGRTNAGKSDTAQASFGPVTARFERQQSSGLGYFTSTYRLERSRQPGAGTWQASCTFKF